MLLKSRCRRLNKFLYSNGIKQDPTCRGCIKEIKSSLHLICHCNGPIVVTWMKNNNNNSGCFRRAVQFCFLKYTCDKVTIHFDDRRIYKNFNYDNKFSRLYYLHTTTVFLFLNHSGLPHSFCYSYAIKCHLRQSV